MERLDKILARRGVGSRQDAQRFCRQGRVTVNGAVMRDPSSKVDPNLAIFVDDQATAEAPLFAMFHKPLDVQSTMNDAWGRTSLDDVLPERWRGQLHPVGRLDADTTGLLMFSADGKLTQRLLHPKHGVEREYIAVVENPVDADQLKARLAAGVETSDGVFPAELLSADGQSLRVAVQEGKYRMVRRILANSGHPVLNLHRIRYGEFLIGDLPEGQVRGCEPSEYAWLLK